VKECVKQKCLQELEPRFMIYANEDLKKYFRENIGEYGDHHTQPVTVDRLRQLLLL
jgi:hypothetical protein